MHCNVPPGYQYIAKPARRFFFVDNILTLHASLSYNEKAQDIHILKKKSTSNTNISSLDAEVSGYCATQSHQLS